MKKPRLLLTAALVISLLSGGCAANAPAESTKESTGNTANESINGYDLTFTKRELGSDWAESKTVRITGQGASAVIGGRGAALSGSVLTITEAGVYRLSGEFSGIAVVVAAGDADKVQLVLDNAAITAQDAPALTIQSADKVFITLPEGSVSTLTDGSARGDNVDADGAVFSRCDLCINGSGTLHVAGQYKHGVVSKDDLILCSVTLEVSAVSTALDGKDCVKATGARITLTAGSNGVRSDNAEDEGRGFVYLEGCTAVITSEGDGVQAETLLHLSGTTLTLTAGGGSGETLTTSSRSRDFFMGRDSRWSTQATDEGSWKGLKSAGAIVLQDSACTINTLDDCIHAGTDVTILSGDYTLSSGDDGVHADSTLQISGGRIVVSKSYEGLEASHLIIAGGETYITASDDGLNAAGGADGSATGNRWGRGMFSGGVGQIDITGGYTVVSSGGDGIDSNRDIAVSGGITLVSGPDSSGNAAFDYDGEATISGGVLIATGAGGMAQNFSSAVNQGAMLVSFGPKAGGESIALTDANGSVLLSFTPVNAYQCAVITSPDIQAGQTYSLLTGCTVAGADPNGFAQHAETSGGTLIDQITMSELLYGGGSGMFQQRQNNRPGGGRFGH